MKKPFQLKPFVVATLRRASYRSPARNECLTRARIERGLYKCALCCNTFPRKGIQVDHTIPVVPITGWDSYESFIERLFCPVEGLQVLCKETCHKNKTKAENLARKIHKRQAKLK